MESNLLIKLIWGAENDLISLAHHSHILISSCRNVIDVQLSFSKSGKPGRGVILLGMAKMLGRMSISSHPQLLQMAPKDKWDYYPLSQNRRANSFPISNKKVLLSMDDLHRIDIILHTQTPNDGSYSHAKLVTERDLVLTIHCPDSAINSLENQLVRYYDRTVGITKVYFFLSFSSLCSSLSLSLSLSHTHNTTHTHTHTHIHTYTYTTHTHTHTHTSLHI